MGQIKPHGGLWAVLLQNNLPADIRQSDSIQAFKSNCVKLLISPYSSVSSAVAPITITSSSGSLSVSINLLTLYLLFMSALLPRTQQTICKHFSNFHFSYFLLLSSHLLLLLLSPPPPPPPPPLCWMGSCPGTSLSPGCRCLTYAASGPLYPQGLLVD